MLRLLLFSAFLWLSFARPNYAVAQVNINPSTSSCSCDGGISFQTDIFQNTYYEWTDISGNVLFQEISNAGISSIGGLCPGVYYLNFDDGSGIQSFLWNVASNVNPGQSISTSICETAGNFTLSSLLNGYTAGGTWTDLTGNPVTNLQSPAALTGTEVFLYTINDNGCLVQTAVEVFIIENADPGQSTTYLICENYFPFLMTDLLPGSPNYGGQWFDSQGNAISGIYDPASMDEALFTYMLDIVPGCNPVFSSLFVIENQISDAGIGSSELICSNADPVNLFTLIDGTPDSGGMWYDSNNFPVDQWFVPEVESAGTYTYVVPGATPCPSVSSQVEVSITAVDPAGQSVNNVLCVNNPELSLIDLLNGNPLSGGYWTDPAGNIDSGLFDPSADLSGSYSYHITIDNCPQEISSVSLSIENLVNAGPDQALVICENDQPLLLADYLDDDVSVSGVWSVNGNSIGGSIFSNYNAGDYELIYSVEGNACPDDESQLYLQVDEAPAVLTDQVITLCEDEVTVDLDNIMGFSAGIISWFDSQGNAISPDYILNGEETSQFQAIAFSGNICANSEANLSLEVDALNAIVPLSGEICETVDQLDLNSYLPSGTSASGNWTNSQNIGISSFVDPEDNGTDLYHYTIDSVNACGSGMFELSLGVYEVISAGIDWTTVLCSNSDPIEWPISEMQTIPGGTWYFLGQDLTQTEFDASTMTAGEYTYQMPANGPCPADESVFTAQILPPVLVNAGENVQACHGSGSIQLGQAPQAGCSYFWSPSNLLSNNEIANPTISLQNENESPLSIDYVVTAVDGFCQSGDTINVLIFPKCELEIVGDQEYCIGESAQISAFGNATNFEWAPFNSETGNSVDWIIEEDLTVTVQGENEYGCTAIDSALVESDPLPVLIFNELPESSCPPLELNLEVLDTTGASIQYEWFMNGNSIGYNSLLPLTIYESGTYEFSVQAITANGCTEEAQIPISLEVPTVPVAQFSISNEHLSTLDEEVTFSNSSLNYSQLQWETWNGELYQTEEISMPISQDMMGHYEVCILVSNELGCADSLCKLIHVEPETVFYAPNAFTPDNDGVNDYFQVYFKGYDPETYHLLIVDRWGNVCFDSEDPEAVWQGNVGGGKFYAQTDSYVWTVSLKEEHTAREKLFKGSVTIIR